MPATDNNMRQSQPANCMYQKSCCLVGIPVQNGTTVNGCDMGPDAFRTAGMNDMLTGQGFSVSDLGNLAAAPGNLIEHNNRSVKQLEEIVSWAKCIQEASYKAITTHDLPIFLGGDHSLSIGTIPGVTRYAHERDQEQFVLWLDAHPDFHSLYSTESGNLHGTPVAYFSGQKGFEGYYPRLSNKVADRNICMMGIRSVDAAEKQALSKTQIEIYDMRYINDHGIAKPLNRFLNRVAAAKGALHVSLDVDFLEPEIAPAVGTAVPGGATYNDSHHVMEMLHESGLVTSLDLAELNPFLDDRGKTASLMVDLCASLVGHSLADPSLASHSALEQA